MQIEMKSFPVVKPTKESNRWKERFFLGETLSIKISFLLLFILFISCNKNPLEAISTDNEWNLCYAKLINENWEIVLNNNNIIKNISNNLKEDNEPSCSPDGNFICYTCFNNSGYTYLKLYNIKKDSSYALTSTADHSADLPVWLSNDKVVYQYHKIGDNYKTYIIDLNSKKNRQLLDFSAKTYFCNNGNDFYYKQLGTDNDKLIYKTNLDGSYNEVILDLNTIGKEYTNLCDYNIPKEKLLLLIASAPRTTNLLAEYDLNTKTFDTLSIAKDGYVFLQPQYSSDYSKIAVIARNYELNTSSIVLLENKEQNILITTDDKDVWFRFYNKIFSNNDRYIIYTKNITHGGEYYYWDASLYVFDTLTKQNFYIDMGINPIWY